MRLGWVRAVVAAGGIATFLFSAGIARAESGIVSFDVSGRPTVHRVFIPVGHAKTVDLNEDVGELAVADGSVADSQPMTNRSLYIEGKAIGSTTILMYSTDKKSLGVIEVEVGIDAASVAQSIREAAPDSRVAVTPINGRIRLAGVVPDVLTMNKVLNVAAQYGDKKDIINALTLGDAQQVNLHVRVLEVNRNAGRELGINWSWGPASLNRPGNSSGAIGDNILNGTPTATVDGTGTTFAAVVANVLHSGSLGNLDVVITALEQKGLVRTLAEPNLTTLSGEQASFLAGGQVPIRTTNNNGEVTITYKDFGVKLQFTPLVLDDKKIQMNIQPEVSDIAQFTSAGDPIFNTRNLNTTVQLRSGQSFAIAGLLQNTNHKIQKQVPWIGQIPVLGTLFRSSSYQKQETELVVIVTPQLSRPSRPGEEPATPFDKTRPSNDPEEFLLGQLEVTNDMIRKYELGEGITGPFGHILDVAPAKVSYAKK